MDSKTITWSDFEQIELRVGTIIEVQNFPEAHKPAYQLRVNFGDAIGTKKSSAQITDLYSKDELEGKQVVGLVNLPSKQIGPFVSECLITGFYRDDGNVVLAVPDKTVPDGATLR